MRTDLAVSVKAPPEAVLSPGELKALVARIRQGFERPLPEK